MQCSRTAFYSRQLSAATAVNCAVSTADGVLYVGTDKGVLYYDANRFVRLSGCDIAVKAMAVCGNTVFACTDVGTYRFGRPGETIFYPLEADVSDAECDLNGNLLLLAKDALYKLEDGGFCLQERIGIKTARSMTVCPNGDIFVVCKNAVMKRYGKRPRWGTMLPDMTDIPKEKLTCIVSDARGMLWVGTEVGVYVFDGRSEWIPPAEFSFFPRCKITALAFGEQGSLLIGTEAGLYIADGEKTRFYGKGRYLVGDNVRCICRCGGMLWAGTENGLVSLRFSPMTLEEKEAYYDALTPAFKRENFFTKREKTVNGDLSTGVVSITDNDGLWTALYVAGQCLKYAVTKNETTLSNARASFLALIKLLRISGIPGFPARAIRRPGEDNYGDGNHEWHASADEKGALEWKGETSSDELTGHFYALAWYYDLCADREEKALIAEVVQEMIDHLLSHGYTLCDTDGTPTTWAHFGPEELNHDQSWCWEKGINALELLTFLRIAYHVTGNADYLSEQQRLAWEAHYAMNLMIYKKDDANSSHIDDRLGFFNITHLLRLETDETLLRYVKFALRRHYEYEKKEHNPYFDFVFAASLGVHTDIAEAIRSLEEYPLDLRFYSIRNSIRPDLKLDPRTAQFGERPHTLEAIPVSERVTDFFSAAPFQLDEYRSDANIVAPTAWLLAYWYGRYMEIL
ncbi:MAG: hypothetical protein IJT27_09325 [Clostridia bacterium]|nr:hypothetical protein [Clostridia bacterium]